MSKIIEIQKMMEVATEELDFALATEMQDEEGRPQRVIYAGENTNFLDTHPIKLDIIINYLQRMKDAGSNYVSIDYNSDGYYYLMEGYKVEAKD